MYVYGPKNQRWCADPRAKAICANNLHTTCCDPSYGDIVGGNFAFKKGVWNTIGLTVDVENDRLQLSVDGLLVISYSNVSLNVLGFQGLKIESFFGGSSADFMPSFDQYAWFKDFRLFAKVKDSGKWTRMIGN